jgi:hypothetical protein
MSKINEIENEDNQNVTQREDKNETPSNNTNLTFFPQEMMGKPCGCGGIGNCSCGSEKSMQKEKSFVYAIGRIQPKFPSLGVEKEYYQAIGRLNTAGQTDYEAMRTSLSKKENRYLARQMCWILSIEGIEAYILKPRDPADIDLLIDSIRAPPRGGDVDVVVGTRGPIAPPEMCNGLLLPIVVFEQIYSFDVDTLMKALPKSTGEKTKGGKKYTTNSEGEFRKIMQMADNFGATDEHLTLNYLAVRYPGYYEKTAQMYEQESSLTNIEVHPSRLAGTRKILDCIFTYKNRKTGVDEKYFCRIDTTEMFPFLVTPMSYFYDR